MKTFQEFVLGQPDSRQINHNGDWWECAWGDYIREVVGITSEMDYHYSDYYNPDIRIEEMGLVVYEILGFPNIAKVHSPTYGALKRYYS